VTLFRSDPPAGETKGTGAQPRPQLVHPPSVIGARTKVVGAISGSGPLTVRGSVEGKIQLNERLTLAPEARVQADVEVLSVEVEGRLSGTLRAQSSVRIVPPGRFEGDAVTPKAHVGLGAVVRGGLLIRSATPRRP
jgi:cytoskeletal protein CcmA (bactofilin family)